MTQDHLLTTREVAALFHVHPDTVTRWAKTGRINSTRTPGGYWRFYEPEVRALLTDRSTRQDGGHRG